MRAPSPFWCRLAAALVCCLSATILPATEKSSSYLTALESIRVDNLRRHVEYLADDGLEGRRAGTRGGRAAAEYLADQFARLGLSGAGVDGGFFQPFSPNYRNVLTVIPGSDATLAREYIVVGAHYDHVGYGSRRTSRGPAGRVHNGADDNASGTAGLLELIEAFKTLSEPPKRSLMFIAFDAEEKGLLGSKHWTAHPTVPLDRVGAMLNLDMIGRLRDDRVTLFGWRSGYGFRRVASRLNGDHGLLVDFSFDIKRNGDHYPFFQRKIPVLFLHTGLHDEYHTPRDDVELTDGPGMSRVVRLAFSVAHDLAEQATLPRFRATADYEASWTERRLLRPKTEPADRLGAVWAKQSAHRSGILLSRLRRDSPAAKAGLRPGDRILKFAGRAIHAADDLTGAISGAVNPAKVVVQRSGNSEPQEMTVELAGKPLRLGIAWREDEAQPGALVLIHVVPGSPAARAGLCSGDRIYQVGGRDFADQHEFIHLANSLPGPLTLLVERHGQVQTVTLQLAAGPAEQAA